MQILNILFSYMLKFRNIFLYRHLRFQNLCSNMKNYCSRLQEKKEFICVYTQMTSILPNNKYFTLSTCHLTQKREKFLLIHSYREKYTDILPNIIQYFYLYSTILLLHTVKYSNLGEVWGKLYEFLNYIPSKILKFLHYI